MHKVTLPKHMKGYSGFRYGIEFTRGEGYTDNQRVADILKKKKGFHVAEGKPPAEDKIKQQGPGDGPGVDIGAGANTGANEGTNASAPASNTPSATGNTPSSTGNIPNTPSAGGNK